MTTKLANDQISGSVINVLDFGAVGDGVTDDTAAIKLARDSISTDFNTSATGGVLHFPRGKYKISSVVEIPPAMVLTGEARHNGTNLNAGSIIDVTHDGVGIRFIRKAGAGTTLTHNGGMQDLIVSGLGASATVAQRLVELGDSGNVDVNNGAWGGFITRCAFNSTYGYGVYSAHSQEWTISGNYFKGVRHGVFYPTVAASAKIIGNSFEMSAASLDAYAIVCYRGALGGAAGVIITDNYLISPKVGIFLSNQIGAVVRNNVVEGSSDNSIYLTKYLIDEATLDVAQGAGFNDGVIGATVDGNTIINWNSDGAGTHSAIQLSFTSKSYVGQNCYTSPNGAAGPAIDVFEDGSDPTDLNVIMEPVIIGSNAGTILPYPAANSILQKNTMLTRDGVKLIVDNYASAGSLNSSDRGKVRLNSNLDIVYFSGTANEIIPRYRGDQTTVGSAGGASALPATPAGYVEVEDPAGGGGTVVIPFYAKS